MSQRFRPRTITPAASLRGFFVVDSLTETPFHEMAKLNPVPEHRFFVNTEWFDEWADVTSELSTLVEQGKMKYRETITEGFENAPQGLRDFLTGKNFGKQIIKI